MRRCAFRGDLKEPACQTRVRQGRFCAKHRARFSRIKTEFEAESAFKRARQKPKRAPVCCRDGCSNDRVPPAAFCDECAAAGWTEEP